MFNLSVAAGPKLTPRIPYWDMPEVKSLDLYMDFTRDGYRKDSAWGPDQASIMSDPHAQPILVSDGLGGWVSRAANQLARSPEGVQSGPTRVNLIRNAMLAGASVGSPGVLPTNMSGSTSFNGITRSVEAVGTIGGLPYIDIRLQGTATAATNFDFFYFESGAAVTVGSPYAFSLFAAIVAGSTASLNLLFMSLAVKTDTTYLGEMAATVSLKSLGSTLTRVEQTGTISNATTTISSPRIQAAILSGAVVDFTIRLAGPQLEVGAFASAPILTAGVATGRSGNAPETDVTGKLQYGVAGFIKVDIKGVSPQLSGDVHRIFAISDGTDDNRLQFVSTGARVLFAMRVSAANAISALDLGAYTLGPKILFFAAGPGFVRAGMVGGTTSAAVTPSAWMAFHRAAFGIPSLTSQSAFQMGKKLGLVYGTADKPVNQNLFDQVTTMAAAA